MREVKSNGVLELSERDRFGNILKTYQPENERFLLETNKIYFKGDEMGFVYAGKGVLRELETQSKPQSLNLVVVDGKIANLFFVKKLDESFLNEKRIFNNEDEKEAVKAFKRIANLSFKDKAYIENIPFKVLDKALMQRVKERLADEKLSWNQRI